MAGIAFTITLRIPDDLPIEDALSALAELKAHIDTWRAQHPDAKDFEVVFDGDLVKLTF